MESDISGRHRAALVAIRAVHSVIWFGVESCMGYVIYAGLAGRSDRHTVVAGESLIYLGNRCRCPLTGVAERLGAARGSVTDIYLPRGLAANLPRIHLPLIILAVYLHAQTLLRRS